MTESLGKKTILMTEADDDVGKAAAKEMYHETHHVSLVPTCDWVAVPL